MKRVLISKEQEKLIKESLQYESEVNKLPSHLANDIQSNNTSLSICDTFDGHMGRKLLNQMVAERFSEVKGYFSDDVSNVTPDRVFDKLSKAISDCQRREKAIRPQLEQLCFNILSDMFHFPEDAFDLEFHLVDDINPSRTFNVFPEPANVDQFSELDGANEYDREIQKRRIIDAICVGGAMRISERALRSCLDELFDLDEELPHLYSKVMKLNEFYLFLEDIQNTDKEHNQAGYVEVVLQTDDSPASIKAEGIIFPILLNECIKGILELLTSYGLPDDEDRASEIVKVADALCYEPWDMRIGPALFDSIFQNVDDVDTSDIPYILPAVSELNPDEFLELINECANLTMKGAQMVHKIANRCRHDKEYDSFENDMVTKQSEPNDKTLVTDEEEVGEY